MGLLVSGRMSGTVMEGIPIEDVKTPKIVTQTFRTVLPVQIMGVIASLASRRRAMTAPAPSPEENEVIELWEEV